MKPLTPIRPVLATLLLLAACASRATAPGTAASVATAAPQALPSGRGSVPFVYVAGYRPEILIFRLDVEAATLTPVGRADGGRQPSYLAIDKEARFLVAANEVDAGRVTAFAIDARTGGLTRLNDASSGGFGPAHVSIDGSGRFVLAANYAGDKPGSVAVLPIGPDGRLAEPVARHEFGPKTMPHFITVDPTNRFVFVPCKGGPYVAQQRFDAATGKLIANQPDRMAAAAGAGPRHMAFHPNGGFAYVINEQAFTIAVYRYDQQTGQLTEVETVATLPADVKDTKGFSTADIHVHPSGKWLYGSNRGHNSIVQFAIDPASGRLTLVGHEGRGIAKPRNFHIDPSGRVLLVANQDSASVTLFRIDGTSGRLAPAGEPVPAGLKPSFVGVALLKGPTAAP
jgi:6-phosphogluconolactonase